jgi:hypothetical protein
VGNVWNRLRNKKEGAFIWAFWHEAVAINSWRARFIVEVDNKCLMCGRNILETIVHYFWECRMARRAWGVSTGIVNELKENTNQMGF